MSFLRRSNRFTPGGLNYADYSTVLHVHFVITFYINSECADTTKANGGSSVALFKDF